MMEKLTHSLLIQPQWAQPKTFQNRYELRAGEQVFAALEFPKTFGSLATAVSADGSWTFKRVGFFKTRVTVRKEGGEADLAVYYPHWMDSEGRLDLAGGMQYHWKTANFWATQYQWSDANGQPLVVFRSGVEDASFNDLFKTQARVEILLAAQGTQDLPLLVLLGWYLMILKQQDDTSAVAATTAAIG